MVLDPSDAWGDRRGDRPARALARLGDKPDYAGLLTYGGLPYTEDPAELAGRGRRDRRRADRRAGLGPARDARSGRGRSARRAARRGRTSRRGSTRSRALRIVDFGDAPVIPADPAATHAAIERDGRRRSSTPARSPSCSAATTRSRSPTLARSRAAARPARARPLRHPHGHRHARSSASSARTGRRCTGSSRRATSTRRATSRSACAATGRARRSFAWQARARDHELLHARRPRARDRGGRRAGARDRRRRPGVLTVDVDVLDPAFAPGHRDARAGRDDLGRAALGLPEPPRGSSSSAPTSSRCSRRRSARRT